MNSKLQAQEVFENFLKVPTEFLSGKLTAKLWSDFTLDVCRQAVLLKQVGMDRHDSIFVADFRDGSAVIVGNVKQVADKGFVRVIAGLKENVYEN